MILRVVVTIMLIMPITGGTLAHPVPDGQTWCQSEGSGETEEEVEEEEEPDCD